MVNIADKVMKIINEIVKIMDEILKIINEMISPSTSFIRFFAGRCYTFGLTRKCTQVCSSDASIVLKKYSHIIPDRQKKRHRASLDSVPRVDTDG